MARGLRRSLRRASLAHCRWPPDRDPSRPSRP
jgi:hypothetical protein